MAFIPTADPGFRCIIGGNQATSFSSTEAVGKRNLKYLLGCNLLGYILTK